MASQFERYMGFTITEYAHPVVNGYVPFGHLVHHNGRGDEYEFQPTEKIHTTSKSAIREAADWSRELVEELSTVLDRRLSRDVYANPLAGKEEQRRSDTNATSQALSRDTNAITG